MKHRHTHVRRARIAAALVAGALGATLVGTAGPAVGQAPTGAAAAAVSTGSPSGPFPVPPAEWVPCEIAFECATVEVPLDHDLPDGPTIGIALLRLRATSPQTRIGSLFVNPGGPGLSGADYAQYFGSAAPAALRERFDIVGFDPRGVRRSAPVACFGPGEEAPPDDFLAPYPETEPEEERVIDGDRRLVDACRANAGAILRHMSTGDVARDLDLLRRAVGDEGLTYLGYSYGSFLGQTYANLFPDRVRALVIDGVLDPRAWVGQGIERWTVPVDTRLRNAESAQQTLDEFFRLCDAAGDGCAFAPDSSRRFDQLVHRLRSGPVEIDDGSGTRVVTLNTVILRVFGGMESSAFWPETAAMLAELEAALGLAEVPSGAASPRAPLAEPPDPVEEDAGNDFDVRPAVVCADSDNPRGYHWYREAADAAAQRFGYFGRFWNWRTSDCAIWPGEARLDRYRGPWDAWTAQPVLVVGNRFDPATGYHGAVAASRLLPNSSLVTYGGWGHGTFLHAGSACVDEAVLTYLLTSATPAGDLTCEPSASPFDPAEQARLAAAPLAVPPATPAPRVGLPLD